jgi:hypothetical protein
MIILPYLFIIKGERKAQQEKAKRSNNVKSKVVYGTYLGTR